MHHDKTTLLTHGTPRMVTLVSAVCKIRVQARGVVRSGMPFDPPQVV
jgi:hypothetical protein